MSWFRFTRTRRCDELESEWQNNIGNNIKFYDEVIESYYEPKQEDEYLPIPMMQIAEENLVFNGVNNELEDLIRVNKKNGKKRFYKPRKIIPRKLRHHLVALRGFSCENCQERTYQHIHHLDENPANNREDNLRLLCRECHKLIHKKIEKENK